MQTTKLISTTTEIHIVAPFNRSNSEHLHAIALYEEYKESHSVILWCESVPLHIVDKYPPVTLISPYKQQAPNGGVLIIWGSDIELGRWYRYSSFERVILIHNTMAPRMLYLALNRLKLDGTRHIEVVYISELAKLRAGIPGQVLYPKIPAQIFQTAIGRSSSVNIRHKFTVGRISQDNLGLHHPDDVEVYKKLANLGINIKIFGGTCLLPWLDGTPNIELLPAVSILQINTALNQLDCFYYRTASTTQEAFPSTLVLAVHTGMLVLCHKSIYAIFSSGNQFNIIPFDSSAEALTIIKSQYSLEAPDSHT